MTSGANQAIAAGLVADGELVSDAIAGREDSFAELVRRYQRPISSYVYRMVTDYDAALDVTQEVFIKVYISLRSYRAEFRFSTWIYKIAHNAAVDHMRRSAVRDQSIVTENAGDTYEIPVPTAHPNPEEASERAERRTEIESVVSQLPPAYRELIILRHSNDLSYEEISDVTNIPLGTVKNRLFRARELMREQLAGRGITSV